MTPLLLDPVVTVAVPALAVEVEVAGALVARSPDTGLARTLEVPRGRVAVGADVGRGGGVFRVTAVRSTTADGYFGIDGEAWVAEVDLAAAELRVPELGARVQAGMVPDLWSAGSEDAWGHGALWTNPGEAFGWMDRSDLGGFVAWNGWEQRVGAAVALTSGEGANWRERNEGMNLAGAVQVAPWGPPVRLTLYGRNGSRGLGLVRDHRLGARVDGRTDQVSGGAEVLQAWGVDGDATRAPTGGSGWATVRPWGPTVAVARVDLTTEALADPAAGTFGWLGAAGVGWDDGAVDLLLGAAQTRRGAAAAAIAGADALALETRFFVQLDVHLSVSTRSP